MVDGFDLNTTLLDFSGGEPFFEFDQPSLPIAPFEPIDYGAVAQGVEFQNTIATIQADPGLREIFLDDRLFAEQDAAGNWSVVDQSGRPVPGVMDRIESALGTNAGRLLATLAIGAGTIGLGRAVAGSGARGARFRAPDQVPSSPIIQAGRGALTSAISGTGTPASDLEQAYRSAISGQRTLAQWTAGSAAREFAQEAALAPPAYDIRRQAVGAMPGLMGPTAATAGIARTAPLLQARVEESLRNPAVAARYAMPDRGRELIEQEIDRVVSGQASNPELERRIFEARRDEEDRLARVHGPGWRDSTAGQNALAALSQRETEARETDRRTTLATYLPQQASRMEWGYRFPREADRSLVGQSLDTARFLEADRSGRLGENAALFRFGTVPRNELVTTLSQYVPLAPLAGLGEDAAARGQHQALINQAALASFQGRSQSERDLAAAFASLGGLVAGSLPRPEQRVRLVDGRSER